MKRLPIWIIVAVLLVGGVIGGILATNSREKVSVNQPVAPSAPAAPTPVQTPLIVTNEPAPAGVIKISVEQLCKDLLADPNRYKKGMVMQVTGIMNWYEVETTYGSPEIELFLDTTVKMPDTNFGVKIIVNKKTEAETFKTFETVMHGSQVVVRGTYYYSGVLKKDNYVRVELKKVSLISSTPAR